MSLDFYLQKRMMTTIYERNITHNLGIMWSEAGIYNDLYVSDGKKAKDIIKNLVAGQKRMLNNPDKYKALEPENKWGTYEDALIFLKDVIKNCEENPDAIIRISR